MKVILNRSCFDMIDLTGSTHDSMTVDITEDEIESWGGLFPYSEISCTYIDYKSHMFGYKRMLIEFNIFNE